MSFHDIGSVWHFAGMETGNWRACGTRSLSSTPDPTKVTCKRCKKSERFYLAMKSDEEFTTRWDCLGYNRVTPAIPDEKTDLRQLRDTFQFWASGSGSLLRDEFFRRAIRRRSHAD